MKKTIIVMILAAALAACGGSEKPVTANAPQTSGGALTINGAGATFPYPIYSKWFAEYAKAHPNVQINYQSIGSGGGIRQLTAKTVFFGATDGPMTDEQLKAAPGAVLHFPTVLGAVVPIYNLPGITQPINFPGAVLADIYLGKIKKWNDAAIAKANPGVTLPATDIAVVHRSDGSGTTYIFVDYLSKVSPAFQQKVGVATSVQWPAGVGAKGNEGVSGLVKQTPGAIGYVELIYASQNNISFGSVQNKAGKFIAASLDSVTAAASGVQVPDDFRVSITNADGENAYPIASFTWLLLYQNADDKQRAQVMVDFMKWALTDGQQFAAQLGYAPLPAEVVAKEQQALTKVQL
ncbi:MAG TPA: phosphate ABC transporter substrate-binding protein PstS [Thermoanaerobaculia bacterium]|nr:phosphate ABC transporter substrate-binding protein PstS [Thermoanaerobaculia bacterium]